MHEHMFRLGLFCMWIENNNSELCEIFVLFYFLCIFSLCTIILFTQETVFAVHKFDYTNSSNICLWFV